MRACSVMPDSVRPHGLQPASSSVHGILQARILEWVPIAFSRVSLPDPEIEPTSPALVGRSFSTELSLVNFPVLFIWLIVGAKSILFKKKIFF